MSFFPPCSRLCLSPPPGKMRGKKRTPRFWGSSSEKYASSPAWPALRRHTAFAPSRCTFSGWGSAAAPTSKSSSGIIFIECCFDVRDRGGEEERE